MVYDSLESTITGKHLVSFGVGTRNKFMLMKNRLYTWKYYGAVVICY